MSNALVCHYFSAAYNVQLRDATFPPTDFQVLSGMAEVKWDKIPAGSNVSHALVLVPLRPGYFNFTSADVTYKVSENAEEVQVCCLCTLRLCKKISVTGLKRLTIPG